MSAINIRDVYDGTSLILLVPYPKLVYTLQGKRVSSHEMEISFCILFEAHVQK